MQAEVVEVSNTQQVMPVQVKATAVAGLACSSEPFYNHGLLPQAKAIGLSSTSGITSEDVPKVVTNITYHISGNFELGQNPKVNPEAVTSPAGCAPSCRSLREAALVTETTDVKHPVLGTFFEIGAV